MNQNIKELNELLAKELGYCPYDDGLGLYAWEWSNDLYWPARATGRMVTNQTPGGLYVQQAEYVRMPLTNKRDRWMITKWCAPETLTDWQKMFPGADYPARGFRVHTDWYNEPGVEPDRADTEKLIWALRKQGAMTRGEMESHFQERADKQEKALTETTQDEVEEMIPAFLNHEPGRRGNRVSLPITKQDKLADGSMSIN